MKKIFTGILCAFLFGAMAMAQQTHTMQIKMKSGETVKYNTTDVENITFSEEAPMPEEFAVTFNTDEITSNSVKVTVTPTNNTRYYAYFWIKSYMINPDGSWLSDDMLVATCAPDPDFDNKCHTGVATISGSNYMPGAEIVLIVFDAEAKTGKTVEVFKYDVKIPDGAVQEDQFVFSNQQIDFTKVSFHVKANNPDGFVMARVVKTEDFESYGETVMQNLYFGINNSAVDKLIKISEYVKMIGDYGEQDFSFENLKPGTKYTAAAFYIDPENNDPTNVYDWTYTRWDFVTPEATSAPMLEVSNAIKEQTGGGKVSIKLHIKAANAVEIRCTPKTVAELSEYLNDDYETWGDLFFGFRTMSQSIVDAANTPEGTDVVFQNIPDDDYYVIARAKNSEGGTKTQVVKVN